jgi:hypothetical protein
MPEEKAGSEEHRPRLVVVVNGREVVFHVHRASGAEIKSAAIAQGVPIQQDFNLFEKRPDHPLKPIGDTDVVELHEGEEFRAVAPDDNSEQRAS